MQILLLLVLAHYPLLLDFMKMMLFSFLFSFVPVFHSNKSSGAHTDYGKFLTLQMIKDLKILFINLIPLKILHRFADVG